MLPVSDTELSGNLGMFTLSLNPPSNHSGHKENNHARKQPEGFRHSLQ